MELPSRRVPGSDPGNGESSGAHIHVVDDDASVRTALARLLSAHGFSVTTHDSAESLLAHDGLEEHGCIVLDMVMPGLDGLALQDQIVQRARHLPIVFLTGQADVQMCAQAMKHGAYDFLTKPVDDGLLLAAIDRALAKDLLLKRASDQRHAAAALFDTLTPREREVIVHVVAGRLNKQIAADLGASEKTVKVHRARGLEKLRVRSVADLVRLVERGGVSQGTDAWP